MREIRGKVKGLLLAGAAASVFLAGAMPVSAAGLKDIFDAKYYADNNEDLKAAFGYDEAALYRHFQEYGLKEGRQMNPILDVAAYRAAYEDLEKAFGDDWDAYVEHYLTYGVYETNRREGVLFDPVAYAEAYADIKQAFGDDIMAIIEHYETFGIQENRTEGTAAGYASIADREQAMQKEAARLAVEAAGETTKTIQNPDGSWLLNRYDESGKTISSALYGPEGDMYGLEKYEYNEAGKRIKTTGYEGGTTLKYVWEYDENGRLAKEVNYDKEGGIASVQIYDRSVDGEVTITQYDGDENAQ
ncbi:MAG: DUF2963 domain-containing protein [Roseburia sp.]|nr:DUF2963 domain-containing protein [Roseburia sp.]MCM1097254.1 DUF2963 domain-containing protein [Ruminococcus flavefaciens]